MAKVREAADLVGAQRNSWEAVVKAVEHAMPARMS
jgi:hypothetical protein